MILSKKIFLCIFSIFPIIDVLNGIATSTKGFEELGLLYRLICLIFIFMTLLVTGVSLNRFSKIVIIITLLSFLSINISSIVLGGNPHEWVYDITVLTKYFLWLIIPLYTQQLSTVFTLEDFHTLFIWISLFLVLGLLIPFSLGLGYATYEVSDVGFKGFYLANNDISIAFIACTVILAKISMKNQYLKKPILSLLLTMLFVASIFCMILLGTKICLFVSIILVIYRFTSPLVNYKLKKQLKIKYIIGILVLINSLFLWKDQLINRVREVLSRIRFFFILFNGDVISVFFSSRNIFFQVGWIEFIKSSNVLLYLFGYGFSYRLKEWGVGNYIEIDFFDLLFSLGILGVTINLLYIFLLINLVRNRRTIYFYAFIVLLVYSMLAGHVFFSGISTTILGLINSAMLVPTNQKKGDR
ncbi:hypothetical protein EH331_13620 [Enterococcus faecalis]|nr:hypothetical protein [Enterococcus faecalis]